MSIDSVMLLWSDSFFSVEQMMIDVVNVEQSKFSEDLLLEEDMSRYEEEEEEEEGEKDICASQTTGKISHMKSYS